MGIPLGKMREFEDLKMNTNFKSSTPEFSNYLIVLIIFKFSNHQILKLLYEINLEKYSKEQIGKYY